MDAMKQVEQMRTDGSVYMSAEVDYRDATTAYMWFCNKIEEFAFRIREEQRAKFKKAVSFSTPQHLID